MKSVESLSLLSKFFNPICRIMGTVGVCILLYWLTMSKTADTFIPAEMALRMANSSLAFVEQKYSEEKVPFFYSTEMESFYEWSNLKRIQESSYSALRDGDFGHFKLSGYIYKYISPSIGFNTQINNLLPLDRLVSDDRPKSCQYWHYLPRALYNVSVIIPFRNEDIRILKRTVFSILLQTPRNLLHEIILVNDNSNRVNLAERIEADISTTFSKNEVLLKKFANFTDQMPFVLGEKINATKIRYFSTGKPAGLVKCLNLGISKATGEILVFLKSHVEVGHNWLPPLLLPILDDWRTVSIPNFATIQPTFDFEKPTFGVLNLVFWNWGLLAENANVSLAFSNQDEFDYLQTLPYQMDLLVESQFAISKEFFRKVGFFDLTYVILSEINLDLSLKILNSGGKVVKVPCSNVFVLKKNIPYDLMTISDELYIENDFRFEPKCFLKTISQRWMNSAELLHFYTFHPNMRHAEVCRDASNHYDRSLQCEMYCPAPLYNLTNPTEANFQYSIATENRLPFIRTNSFVTTIPDANIIYGNIMNPHYAICVHVDTSSESEKLKVETAYCREKPTVSTFRLDASGIIRIDKHCLCPSDKLDNGRFALNFVNCFFSWNQLAKWHFTPNGQLQTEFEYEAKLCLSYEDVRGILLAPCSASSDPAQVWKWIN